MRSDGRDRAGETDRLSAPVGKREAHAGDSGLRERAGKESIGIPRVSISQQTDRGKSCPRLPHPLPAPWTQAGGAGPKRKNLSSQEIGPCKMVWVEPRQHPMNPVAGSSQLTAIPATSLLQPALQPQASCLAKSPWDEPETTFFRKLHSLKPLLPDAVDGWRFSSHQA